MIPGQALPDLGPEAERQVRALLELLGRDERAPTTVRDAGKAWQTHVLDSLAGLAFPELMQASRVADVGTGAGFPGLVLAAALPEARFDLIEATRRKCEFVRRAITIASITNAEVVCDRAEGWARRRPPDGGREAYDAVTARAVGRLATLAELASPLLREGGVLVAWKGRRDAAEEEEADRAGERLAMQGRTVRPMGAETGFEHRHLYLYRKVGPTPEGIPRRPGMAKKRPLGLS